MKGSYIEKIKINKVRHLENIIIDLARPSIGEVKHLILTGKNGSGKTSVLVALRDYLIGIPNQHLAHIPGWRNNMNNMLNRKEELLVFLQSAVEPQRTQYANEKAQLENGIASLDQTLRSYTQVELTIQSPEIVTNSFLNGEYIIAYFDSKRITQVQTPSGVNRLHFAPRFSPDEKASTQFLQFLVNLKAERAFAKDDDIQHEAIGRIDAWFGKFEGLLRTLFSSQELKLKFDNKKFNFYLEIPGREPFDLNQLSDGYSSVISMVTEILLRMEEKRSVFYDLPGIVLIDEIETHLHLELQKQILPFLVTFFPNIQFIVTTHSPFVLNSVNSAVIYDLENRQEIEDLSIYTYSSIVEGFFRNDQYSSLAKEKLARLRILCVRKEKSPTDFDEMENLFSSLEAANKFLAPEIYAELQLLRLENWK